MNVNLQLWSLRDEAAKDFFGTLEKVAEMGYTGVEFAGFGDIPAEDMRKKLDELGLQGISAHVGLDKLSEDLDGVIQYMKTIGGQYIICPGADVNSVKNAEKLALEFNEIGRKCLEQGLKFGYHNHDFEFRIDEGQYPLDVLFDCVDPKYVIQEPDIFWVAYAGLDAMEYLAQHKDRCPIIHLKQINGNENVNAGDGHLDFKAVKDMCPNAIFVYEQEEYPGGAPLECVKESAEYLLKL